MTNIRPIWYSLRATLLQITNLLGNEAASAANLQIPVVKVLSYNWVCSTPDRKAWVRALGKSMWYATVLESLLFSLRIKNGCYERPGKPDEMLGDKRSK